MTDIWIFSHFLPINNAVKDISSICFHTLGYVKEGWNCLVIHGNCVLNFWGTAKLFPKAAAVFYIPTNNVRGFQLLHTLDYSLLSVFLIIAILVAWYEVVSHYSFDFHFCNDQWCWASLQVLVGHLYTFGEMSIQIPSPFLIVICFLLLVFLLLSCKSMFCILDPHQYMICKHFFSSCPQFESSTGRK